MAIARGSGTEIIRAHSLEQFAGTSSSNLIIGAQHHIYTVLSIFAHGTGVNAAGDFLTCFLRGYDSVAGTTQQICFIFLARMYLGKTFVWNDPFSFNGFEPVDFAGPQDDATKQNAIADQGSSVATTLEVDAESSGDNFDIHITFLDQNNS